MTANTPANYEAVRCISRVAGQDMSGTGTEYRFCVVQADGTVIVNTNAGAKCLGVLNGKAPLGAPVEVGIGGRNLVVLGGTVVAGGDVESDANGAAIAYSSGERLGTSLTGGSAGDISDIVFDRG